jgi:hypothetical protein
VGEDSFYKEHFVDLVAVDLLILAVDADYD